MFERIISYFKKKQMANSGCKKVEDLFSSLDEEAICFHIGADLCPEKDTLVETIQKERQKIKDLNGFILPVVRLYSKEYVQENAYRVFVNGSLVEENYVIPTKAKIVEELKRTISDLCEKHLDEIFTNELVEKYIEKAGEKNGRLVADLCGWLATVEIKHILVDLLKNGKSIENITHIFEKISEQLYINSRYERLNIEKISKSVVECI